MKQFFALLILVVLAAPASAQICGECKTINEKIQDIQLESDPGKAIDMMVDLSTYIRSMKLSKDAEIKKRQYLTLFEASFKLEEHDMDLEIPEILASLYKKNKKEFKNHLRLLPKDKRKKVIYKMKLVNIYIHFGEGKTFEKFIKKNPSPKDEK